MPEDNKHMVDISDLRIGLYVHLDLGWMEHPFPLGNFKITSQKQIDTLRTLELQRIRYSPDKSDPPTAPAVTPHPAVPDGPTSPTPAASGPSEQELALEHARARLAAHRQAQLVCERQFNETARTYRQLLEDVRQRPDEAKAQSLALVQGLLGQMVSHEESAIRLLSDVAGERTAIHSVNVVVLSLLLGKAMNMDAGTLQDLGLAALMHDIGKLELPDWARYRDERFTSAQFKMYQEHVAHSVNLGRRMGLSNRTLITISQHHEMADGSGFPLSLALEKMVPPARVLSLIDHYDDLCNPSNPIKALTPHEALSLIFTRSKQCFDPLVLNAFIRMMGVYPPGSLVQLTDQRYAMVMAVNSSRPLKPRVLVHDPAIPKAQALWLDLEQEKDLGVLRSLRPEQMPRKAMEYLSPQQRMCYFFERAVELPTETGTRS